MLRVGRRNSSILLMVLFAVWVLAPFVALAVAHVISKRWSVLRQATLHGLMLILAMGSLAIYGNVAFGPPRPQPAFMFLVVPLASGLLMAIVLPLAAVISRRRSRQPN